MFGISESIDEGLCVDYENVEDDLDIQSSLNLCANNNICEYPFLMIND